MSNELRALFEIHRQQTLLNGLKEDGSFRLPEEYLYAVAKRLCPIFNDEWCQGDDPFEDLYDPTREFMESVIAAIFEAINGGGAIPTFYELERSFGGRERRVQLIDILHYARLDEQFSDEVVSQILKPTEHPIEAARIAEPLSPSDLIVVY